MLNIAASCAWWVVYFVLRTASEPPMLPPTVAPTMIRTAANSVQKFLLRSPNIVRGWCPANSGLAGADSGGCDTLRYPYAS
jgi:hypothetical protein